MRTLLSERRPKYVEEMAAAQFERVSESPFKQGYRYIGDDETYHWPGSGVDSSKLLFEDGLCVLDVGAGKGNVVKAYAERNDENSGIGLTAFDYSSGRNPHVIVGDAHRLDNALDDRTFDLIISKWTLQHMVDPMACLEEMLNRVEPGGIIVTDLKIGQISLTSYCIQHLIESDMFSLHSNTHADTFLANTDVCLRREAPGTVTLPITYQDRPLLGSMRVLYDIDEAA